VLVLGVRRLLILLDIASILFISLQMLDLSTFMLIFTRFFLGIIIGINSAVIPKYLLSLSPSSMSGVTGSLNQLFITIGIAVAYAVGFSISEKPSFVDLEPWRKILFLPALTCLTRALILMFCLPYTSYNAGSTRSKDITK
jgi:SP family myo-inositol transporter-like MFS transporter 13